MDIIVHNFHEYRPKNLAAILKVIYIELDISVKWCQWYMIVIFWTIYIG